MNMMLEALKVREAHAPLAGGRDAVGLVSIGRQLRRARPRSAVTVSLDAPGLAPLTGFSRSSGRSRYSLRSVCRPNRRFGLSPCRGLEARVALFVLRYLVKRAASHFTRPSSVSAGGGLFVAPGTST